MYRYFVIFQQFVNGFYCKAHPRIWIILTAWTDTVLAVSVTSVELSSSLLDLSCSMHVLELKREFLRNFKIPFTFVVNRWRGRYFLPLLKRRRSLRHILSNIWLSVDYLIVHDFAAMADLRWLLKRGDIFWYLNNFFLYFFLLLCVLILL